jgi:hypothetical protein
VEFRQRTAAGDGKRESGGRLIVGQLDGNNRIVFAEGEEE